MVRTARPTGIPLQLKAQKCNCGCRPCACDLILVFAKEFKAIRDFNDLGEEKKLHYELKKHGFEPEHV